MRNDDSKAARILFGYDRLRKGFVLNKEDLADEFKVTQKTIQRDLNEIRAYIAERYIGEAVRYDTRQKGYRLVNNGGKPVSAIEVFALVKIVLESRAFNKSEMDALLNAVCGMASKPERKAFNDLILNEKFHYEPVTHGKPLLELIWDIGQCIMKKEVIEIGYTIMNGEERRRIVYPLAVVFSEFYFYLIAKFEDSEYNDPTFFRVDRIDSVKRLGRTHAYRRFEDGELKKRVQFMYGGELVRLRFLFRGPSLEAILDRFPTAVILRKDERGTVIEAEVFGKGCLIWLLGQGKQVELLGPEPLREEFRQMIRAMNEIYL
ncbi:WYL domain-containing protein [Paenibacillus lycopersici]|uniref:WYL domain-containing protein n=1 Tax=Paenibacillus lycopersici TaxID=2704462 RepID=A0A6C0FVM7_9BACL|nr:WYL domain-containing protein [Paenibacillus lycopersici]QHT59009.1 WYL domain-containing protein [Paenibacillus lycopersici]